MPSLRDSYWDPSPLYWMANPEISDLRFEILNPEHRTPNTEHRTPKTENRKPKTENLTPKTLLSCTLLTVIFHLPSTHVCRVNYESYESNFQLPHLVDVLSNFDQ